MKDVLVVYYSRTGRTRWVAEQLAAILDADIEEVLDAKDRSGAVGFLTGGCDATFKRSTALSSEHSTQGRKVVVVGMPVWAFGPPPAVRAYLGRVNLAGVKVCAFCTMDGSGGGRTFREVASLLPHHIETSLALVKPRADEPATLEKLRAWAAQIPSS